MGERRKRESERRVTETGKRRVRRQQWRRRRSKDEAVYEEKA